MKETGFIQSNLSKRKFKKDLKWINKFSYCCNKINHHKETS